MNPTVTNTIDTDATYQANTSSISSADKNNFKQIFKSKTQTSATKQKQTSTKAKVNQDQDNADTKLKTADDNTTSATVTKDTTKTVSDAKEQTVKDQTDNLEAKTTTLDADTQAAALLANQVQTIADPPAAQVVQTTPTGQTDAASENATVDVKTDTDVDVSQDTAVSIVDVTQVVSGQNAVNDISGQTNSNPDLNQNQGQAAQNQLTSQAVQTAANNVNNVQTNQPAAADNITVEPNLAVDTVDATVDLNQVANLSGQVQTVAQSTSPAVKAAFSSQLTQAADKVAEQIAQPLMEKAQTTVSTNGEVKTITLQLTPAKLGNVKVVMQVSDQGVSLKFNVQTYQAKELLQSVTGKLDQIMRNAQTSSTSQANQLFNLPEQKQTENVVKAPKYEQNFGNMLNFNSQGQTHQFGQDQAMRQMRTVAGYQKAPVLEETSETKTEEQVPTSTISILA